MRFLLFSLLFFGTIYPQNLKAFDVKGAYEVVSKFSSWWKERKYCQICRNETLNGRQCGDMFSTIAQASVQTNKIKKTKLRNVIAGAEKKGLKLTKEQVAKSLSHPARWDSKFLYANSGYTLNVENNAKEIIEGREDLDFEESMEMLMEKIQRSPKSNQTLLNRITGSVKGIFGRVNPKKYVGWLCKTHCQAKTKFPLKIGDDLFKLEIKERYGQRQCMRFYHQYPRVHNQAVASEVSRVRNNIISVPVYTEHEGKFASRLIEQIIEDTILVESRKKFKLYFPSESDEIYNEQNKFQTTVIHGAENRLRRNLAALVALRDRNILDVYRPMISSNGLPREIQTLVRNELRPEQIDTNTVFYMKNARLFPSVTRKAEGSGTHPPAEAAVSSYTDPPVGPTPVYNTYPSAPDLSKSQRGLLRQGSRDVYRGSLRENVKDTRGNQGGYTDAYQGPIEGTYGDTNMNNTTGYMRDSSEFE